MSDEILMGSIKINKKIVVGAFGSGKVTYLNMYTLLPIYNVINQLFV
jgi:hypothetical protein